MILVDFFRKDKKLLRKKTKIELMDVSHFSEKTKIFFRKNKKLFQKKTKNMMKKVQFSLN